MHPRSSSDFKDLHHTRHPPGHTSHRSNTSIKLAEEAGSPKRISRSPSASIATLLQPIRHSGSTVWTNSPLTVRHSFTKTDLNCNPVLSPKTPKDKPLDDQFSSYFIRVIYQPYANVTPSESRDLSAPYGSIPIEINNTNQVRASHKDASNSLISVNSSGCRYYQRSTFKSVSPVQWLGAEAFQGDPAMPLIISSTAKGSSACALSKCGRGKGVACGGGSLSCGGGVSGGAGRLHDAASSCYSRLRINVTGHVFETRLWVLNQHPTTLLGSHERRNEFYDASRDELFFDRHRPSFEAIFAYYQGGGRLHRPPHVPTDVFVEELEFFCIEPRVVDEHKRSEGYSELRIAPSPTNRTSRLWLLFEYPETSRAAFAVGVLSVVTTLVSIVLFCVETLPTFALSHCVGDEAPNFLDPFFIIETMCTAWFTLEAVVRLVTCPSKRAFCTDVKNLVDVAAILPYYVTFFHVISTMSCSSAKASASLAFLRVTRLIRVFKLTKHSVGLQVLLLTFRASLAGLFLFLTALCVSLIIFASAIYYVELGVPHSNIQSMPDAFWWAIITMTTVGYGDRVPKGVLGKVVGSACAISGVITLAIPVPIITGNFNKFYAHRTGRGRHV